MGEDIIRSATVEDAESLRNIYAYYVEHTAISFEYDVPTVEEFRGRIEKTLKNYPYLVVEKDGEIKGYAYAGPFVGRPAYGWCAELTIYLKHGATKCGYGRMLYEALENELKDMGYKNLYACIGYTDAEDEYLNNNSPQFHEHMGFELVGTFHNCGHKFGRWYHMIWMEKIIGTHEGQAEEIKSISSKETSMENSYRFFQNKACKYFPCHEGVENFNCLFCYCPLYGMEKCPGRNEYLTTKDGKKIKACDHCTFPHEAKNYDIIMKFLSER